MTDYEILSRSSATLIELPRASDSTRFAFLAPAHVTAPWDYRNYYNQDWLSFLNESNVKAFIGVHDDNGLLLKRYPMQHQLRRHRTLDLVLLRLEDETSFKVHDCTYFCCIMICYWKVAVFFLLFTHLLE